MRASTATAGVFAALVLAASPLLSGAASADPYGDDDDEVYAEEYVYEKETYERAPPRRYGGGEPHPQYNSYKDDPDHLSYKDDPADVSGAIKDGYPVPMPPPKYGEAPPPPPRAHPPKRVDRFACLDSYQVERRLRHDGWTDIRALHTRRGVTDVNARRIDTGRPFSLRVDRCSGELISARPRLRVFGGHRHHWPERRWAGGGWHH